MSIFQSLPFRSYLLTAISVVTGSAPRMGTFVFIVIAVQVMLLGAYILYRKRRDSAPKKYL